MGKSDFSKKEKMFDGEWKRCQSDSTEQLAKVLGIVTKSGVANEIMLEMLNGYISAELTTNIDENDNRMKVNRRWWFSHTQAEEQEVEFEYGKICEFPVTADNSSVQGQFDKISPILIRGNEGNLSVTYKIQDGKLVEILSGNGYNFKQISTEKLHTSKLFIP